MGVARTVREGNLGKRKLRLAEKDGKFFGLADGKVCAEGDNADVVWQQLHDEAGRGDPKYFGYVGARNRFLTFFPNGFESEGYRHQERDYKLVAKSKLDSTVPLEQALNGKGYGEAILSVFRSTNMLSPFEKTRLQDVFRGASADVVVQAMAAFAHQGDKAALRRLELVLKPLDAAKWTVATYLPYLWRPDQHMFLKPEVTKDYATRVGHPLGSLYQAQLNFDVYASLLDLTERTYLESNDLGPRDRIDIQSFVWVVGDYQEGREQVYP
jgi:hypothetical protein